MLLGATDGVSYFEQGVRIIDILTKSREEHPNSKRLLAYHKSGDANLSIPAHDMHLFPQSLSPMTLFF